MRTFVVIALALAPLGALWAWTMLGEDMSPAPALERSEAQVVENWLAIGFVAEPSSTQVSLAQDARLIASSLGAGGAVLFGQGEGTLVQVVDEAPQDLRARLGAFFEPRDRATRYEPVAAPVDGPADFDSAFGSMLASADASGPELLLIGFGHGERGDEPVDSAVRTWGGWPLTANDLAQALEGQRDTIRVVWTTCFGGGFAHAVFRGGDPEAGLTSGERCGFFATTWDREASGCDPDPDRGQQDGYAMHFFAALAGRDRDGERIALDYDSSGDVSFLEAHTHARIATRSFDVPITTSEVWLRARADELGVPVAHGDEPEERAVVTAVGAELGLRDVEAALDRGEELDAQLDDRAEAFLELEQRADDAYFALRIRLLERWPILDDPWHPEFEETLRSHGQEIDALLTDSAVARLYRAASEELDEAIATSDAIEVERSRVTVLVRAYENLALSGAVHEAGGEDLRVYRQLRACERGTFEASPD